MDLLCHEPSLANSGESDLFHGDTTYLSSSQLSSSPSYSSSSSSGIGSISSQSQSPPPQFSSLLSSSSTSSTIFSSVNATSSSNTVSPVSTTSSSAVHNTTKNVYYANNYGNYHQNHHQIPYHHQHIPNSRTTALARERSGSLQQYYSPTMRKAERDPIFLDERCLINLFQLEKQFISDEDQKDNYGMKGDITLQMRKIVASWMMELCEGRSCQEEVCLLALNYMDRFLARSVVMKNHLQLLAAACLLLASKLREPSCRCLNADTLVYFTDNSIKKLELIHYELLVLSVLNWDISVVTPLDFLEHFLNRLDMPNEDLDKVRLHAQAFICLAAQEKFDELSSTIAAASIAVSINGLRCWGYQDPASRVIINKLIDDKVSMGRISSKALIDCMNRMESIYQEQKQKLIPDYMLNTPPNSPNNDSGSHRSVGQQVVPATPQKCKVQANTSATTIDDLDGELIHKY